MNKFPPYCKRHHLCPIIRWNKPKDKGNKEVILLPILLCIFCKIFPAVQDCSKLHMLSLACCEKKKKEKNSYFLLRVSDKKKNWVTCYICIAQSLDKWQCLSQYPLDSFHIMYPMPCSLIGWKCLALRKKHLI